MTTQKSTSQNAKSGRGSSRLGHFSKTGLRCWQDRLFRETYRNNGRLHKTSHWSARIQHEGRRERFPHYTPNKAAAAAKARISYVRVQVGKPPKEITRRAAVLITQQLTKSQIDLRFGCKPPKNFAVTGAARLGLALLSRASVWTRDPF
jgi:hypothetical protein